MSHNETENVTAEVTEWFFEDYLPTWVGVGNRAIGTGPGFILNYWGVPLYDYHPDGGQWALNGDSVVGFLNTTHTGCKPTATPTPKWWTVRCGPTTATERRSR
jgi:hypothetical protein